LLLSIISLATVVQGFASYFAQPVVSPMVINKIYFTQLRQYTSLLPLSTRRD